MHQEEQIVFERVWPNDFHVWVGVVCMHATPRLLTDMGEQYTIHPLKGKHTESVLQPRWGRRVGGHVYLTATEARGIQNGLWPYQYICHEHKS